MESHRPGCQHALRKGRRQRSRFRAASGHRSRRTGELQETPPPPTPEPEPHLPLPANLTALRTEEDLGWDSNPKPSRYAAGVYAMAALTVLPMIACIPEGGGEKKSGSQLDRCQFLSSGAKL